MKRKCILYILLVVGLVAIGCGIWMLSQAPPEIDVPEGEPVVFAQIRHLMNGTLDKLYIYDDGTLIYVQDTGLRFSDGTRSWSTGNIARPELNSLMTYLETSGLDAMEDYYQISGEPGDNGSYTNSDMQFTVTVNSGNLARTVVAFGYLSPDHGETYPDMPTPLNTIYEKLRAVSKMTEEVYQHAIPE